MEPDELSAPPEALRYIRTKLPRESWHWTDLWGEEHARQFVVAKATQLDVVNTIHAEVTRAIQDGNTLEDFRASLEPRLRALGWWGQQRRVDPVSGRSQVVTLGTPRRLQVIYWANTRTAYAAGQWERIERVKERLPLLLYNETTAEEPRPEHLEFVGLILPVDDPFWRTHFPPNGWMCQCSVDQITRDEADELLGQAGYSSMAPDVAPRPWVNPRTGEIKMVPRGVDPGWGSNPGLARQDAVRAHLAGRLEQAPPEIRRAAVLDLVGSATFQLMWRGAFQSDRRLHFPIGVVPHTRLPALPGAPVKPNTVWFSPETAAKQRANHPEVTAEDYARVQGMLERGEIAIEPASDTGTRQFAFTARDPDGRSWRMVVKETADGTEWFLVSLHPIDDKRRVRRLRRGEVVRAER